MNVSTQRENSLKIQLWNCTIKLSGRCDGLAVLPLWDGAGRLLRVLERLSSATSSGGVHVGAVGEEALKTRFSVTPVSYFKFCTDQLLPLY